MMRWDRGQKISNLCIDADSSPKKNRFTSLVILKLSGFYRRTPNSIPTHSFILARRMNVCYYITIQHLDYSHAEVFRPCGALCWPLVKCPFLPLYQLKECKEGSTSSPIGFMVYSLQTFHLDFTWWLKLNHANTQNRCDFREFKLAVQKCRTASLQFCSGWFSFAWLLRRSSKGHKTHVATGQ